METRGASFGSPPPPKDDISRKTSIKGDYYYQWQHPYQDGLRVVPPPDGIQIAAQEHDDMNNFPQVHPSQLPWRPPTPGPLSNKGVDEKAVEEIRGKRIFGIPRRRFLWVGLIVFLLLALVIVLASVLGVMLSRNAKKNSSKANPSQFPTANGTAPSSPSSLASGGTGLALTVVNDGSGTIMGYAQQTSGELREYILRNGQWAAQNDSNGLVTKDAKQGAPIAALAYNLKGAATRRVFYIDKENILQEAIITDTANSWERGPLGQLLRQPSDNPNVGLCACWNDQYFGQPISVKSGGIRLYFGDAQGGNIQEMGWSAANPLNQWDSWYQFSESYARAGVSCATNGSSIINVYMSSNKNGNPMMQWMYDYNVPVTSGWQKIHTNDQLSLMVPTSAINNGTSDYLYYQDPDLSFSRVQVDNSNFPPKWSAPEVVDKQAGYNGSKIATALSAGQAHLVFQAENSHVADLVSENGRVGSLEIPIRDGTGT